MAIPTSITDLDTNEAMNSPAGSDNVGGTLDNFLRIHAAIIRRQFSKGADINSASTTVIPADCSFANVVKVVSTINGFSDNFNGRIVCLKFDAGITLVHSSSLVLPSAANIVTEAGDVAFFINESVGVWRCIGYLALLQRNVTNAAKASGTSFTPAGNLVATNVQAALQELDTALQNLDAEKQNALGYTPLNRAGDTMVGPLTLSETTTSNKLGVFTNDITTSIGSSSSALAPLEVLSDSGLGAAFMAFRRATAYAVYFGLDTDNSLAVGGWSMGNVARKIWHEGNFPKNTTFGPDQVLGSYTGSRSPGNTYTNSTPRPISVYIQCTTTGMNGTIMGIVAGLYCSFARTENSGNTLGVNFIVPPGSTYSLFANNASLTAWNEYR